MNRFQCTVNRFLNLEKIIFMVKEVMKKTKNSVEVPQKNTRSNSKIIETIHGGIIDFSKFKAEPKKTIKNSKDNLTSLSESVANTDLYILEKKTAKKSSQKSHSNLNCAVSVDKDSLINTSEVVKKNATTSSCPNKSNKNVSKPKTDSKKYPYQMKSGQNGKSQTQQDTKNKDSTKNTKNKGVESLGIGKISNSGENVKKTKKTLKKESITKKVDKIVKSEDLKTETKSYKPKKSPLKREYIKIEMQNPLLKYEVEASASKSTKFVPPNWEQVVKNLKEMRKDWNAPVDTMGCHKCEDETASPKDKRYQNLLALMLSSQTKDQVTHAAMQRLIEHGCTVDKISATSDDELGKLIYPVSFWKNKVTYIKKTTEILKNQYERDIPQTVDELIKLPGVGPKMAHLCMQVAWNEVTGIGVDTHVHRISNRLGWVNTKTPEQTRMELEKWLPKEHWAEINTLLVGFGQTTCTSEKPKCGSCMNNPICPSASELM